MSTAPRRLRLHYCALKSGRDVGTGDVGAGFQDFLNEGELVHWLQRQCEKGITMAVLAVRVLG